MGEPGHAVAESVLGSGQSGVREPAPALAGGEPQRAGGGAELDWRRPEYLRQLQRHREDRSHIQSGLRHLRPLLWWGWGSGCRCRSVPCLLPAGTEPDAQRVDRTDRGVHVAPGEPAGHRLQLLQADVQRVRHLIRPRGGGAEHGRVGRSVPERGPEHHRERLCRRRRQPAARPRRQDDSVHRHAVVRDRLAPAESGSRLPAVEAVHLLRQQQARHVHLRRDGRAMGLAADNPGQRLAQSARGLHGWYGRHGQHRTRQHAP